MSYSSEVLADSPRGYWKMNEGSGNVQDSSGLAHHADQVVGTAGNLTYGVTGPITGDTAIRFGGSVGFSVPDHADLDLADVWTIEGWINLNATTGTYGIISKQAGAYYARRLSTGEIDLLASQTAQIVQSTVTITDTTTWHHVVCTKNGATCKIYIDGVDRTGTVTNTTTVNNANNLLLGTDATDASSESITGDMAHLAVYSTALSQARVTAHYNASVATTASVAWLSA